MFFSTIISLSFLPYPMSILLAGQEDSDILEYFRRKAFPKEDHIRRVIDCIEQSEIGLTKSEVEQAVNLRPSQITHVLKFLNVENPAPILKQGWKWVALPTASDYCLDAERVQFLTEQREQEWRPQEIDPDPPKACTEIPSIWLKHCVLWIKASRFIASKMACFCHYLE